MTNNLLSQLPSVDKLLSRAESLIAQYGRQQVTNSLREVLSDLRQTLRNGGAAIPSTDVMLQAATHLLNDTHHASLRPVLNLTGTVLHTNLGRAELPQQAIDAVIQVATGYSNLEFDIEQGKRGDRDQHIEELLLTITGAEAATVVNNNAAAVLLALNTLANGREVPVSRGELVEIGGSFRIPEVMQRSNCQLVEVGATNRTHLKDYASAITGNTALLMKVHTSNYEIQGFTKSVSDQEIAALATEHGLPYMTDLGSGTLVDLSQWGLPYEPTVQSMIEHGVDLVTFSGDKLLGGPQCGIIVGKKDLVAKIKNNPMKRALRVDKMTIAALFEVLKLYLDPDSLAEKLPTLKYLSKKQNDIRLTAELVLPEFQAALGIHSNVAINSCESQIGSGSLPVNLLPSYAIKITPKESSDKALTRLASNFRNLPLPVLGRIHDGSLMFDLRTLKNAESLTDQLHLLVK